MLLDWIINSKWPCIGVAGLKGELEEEQIIGVYVSSWT